MISVRDRLKRINEAEGDVARFSALLAEYIKAPIVTRRRIYIENPAGRHAQHTLQDHCRRTDARRGIIAVGASMPHLSRNSTDTPAKFETVRALMQAFKERSTIRMFEAKFIVRQQHDGMCAKLGSAATLSDRSGPFGALAELAEGKNPAASAVRRLEDEDWN